MISYSKLGAKIWKLVDYFEPALIRDLKAHNIEALDREILDWYDSVPESIKVASLDPEQIPVPSGPQNEYDLQRLQVWTRLRLNQVRIALVVQLCHPSSANSLPDSNMAPHPGPTQRQQHRREHVPRTKDRRLR